MVFVSVEFEDGDYLESCFNGTVSEALRHYAPGKVFNLGSVDDRLTRVKRVKVNNKIAAPNGNSEAAKKIKFTM